MPGGPFWTGPFQTKNELPAASTVPSSWPKRSPGWVMKPSLAQSAACAGAASASVVPSAMAVRRSRVVAPVTRKNRGRSARSAGRPGAYTGPSSAGVAQLVEQRSCKAWVVGSNPISGFAARRASTLGVEATASAADGVTRRGRGGWRAVALPSWSALRLADSHGRRPGHGLVAVHALQPQRVKPRRRGLLAGTPIPRDRVHARARLSAHVCDDLLPA
jgi:hypothetical protein